MLLRHSHRPFISGRLLAGALLVSLIVLPTAAAWAQGSGLIAGRTFFGKNKIQYRNFDWQIYHSTHFDVYYYPEAEPLLEDVVSFAESAYDQLSTEFDFQIQDPVPLIYYDTHAAFEQNNIFSPSIPVPEAVGAFATSVKNRMVLPVDLPDNELYELLLHELTHIFEYEILFQGRLGKGIRSTPPQWVMEGLASYMAKDEASWARMYLRDAVVNDNVPSITQRGVSGYFAYRFGHAAFDYMEERWGSDGLRDFIFELRNTIGQRPGRAIERALRIEPEDFDIDFRRWLRKRYLPQLVETGEPSDFGRLFSIRDAPFSQELSPAASPSGDLVAAFTSFKGEVDIALFDGEKRTFIRNLTKGLTSDVQYFNSQFLTATRMFGRDMTFSPDGNTLAVFGKREGGRSLVLIDLLRGGIEKIIDMEIGQQLSPAWSPDGQKIAFSGWKDGSFDVFLLDLASGEYQNITQDELFDGGPTFSPDGKSVVFSSVINEHAQLFRVEVDKPGVRYQITDNEVDDADPVFTSDGKKIYYTSNPDNIDNIYSLDLESGQILQHTNSVTGCFMPTLLSQPEGEDLLVYTGFWKGRFNLYLTDLEEPLREPQVVELGEEPVEVEDLAVFEPGIEVSLDPANQESYGGFRFFLEDADAYVGVTDDQTLLGQTVLQFSDFLGDRRIIASFSSIANFQNFNVIYADFKKRLQWQVRLFDDQDFFVTFFDPVSGQTNRQRRTFRQTGLVGTLSYPINTYNRFEIGGGYVLREFDSVRVTEDNVDDLSNLDGGGINPFQNFELERVEDDFPILQTALVGDNVIFANFGPLSGHRFRIGASYAPDLDDSGTLVRNITFDGRKYFRVSDRTNFALRLYGGQSSGNRPDIFYFGGLDTVRGLDFRSQLGDTVFFGNLEFRFPLIDLLITPVFNFQSIRGRIFLDIGGGYFAEQDQDFDFWDSENDRLADAVSSYGFGLSVRFAGLDLHWDFAKLWDLDSSVGDGSFATSFWIGPRF